MSTQEINWSQRRMWAANQIVAERARLDAGNPPSTWGDPREVEIRRRVRLSVAAYAYEIVDTSVMSDSEFDKLAQHIRPRMSTGHPLLDEFFSARFSAMTGMWIREHPELDKIEQLFRKFYADLRSRRH